MKYVLLTGTSTGIGRAALEVLIDHGYFVFGSVRKEQDKKRLQKEITSERFYPLLMDVANAKDVKKAFQTVKKVLGDQPLYALINNAGMLTSGPFLLNSLDEYRHVFEVNFFGLLNLTKTMVPLMKSYEKDERCWSRVINVSSVFGHYGLPYLGTYVTSKYALEGFAESVGYEFKQVKVHLVTFIPGSISTPIFDKGIGRDAAYTRGTPFEKSALATKKFMSYIESKGVAPERAGKKIVKILETGKPSHHYYLIGRKTIEWILPRYTPRFILSFFYRFLLKI